MSFSKGVVVKTSAPSSTDDGTKGFYVGFNWVFASGGTLITYQCTDNSTGAAVWNVTSSNQGGGDSFCFSGSVNNASITTSQDLRQSGGVRTNLSPYIMPKAGKLFAMSASHQGAPAGKNWTLEVFKNGVSAATLVLNAVAKNQRDDLSVAFAQGDEVRLRLTYTAGTIVRPEGSAFFKFD